LFKKWTIYNIIHFAADVLVSCRVEYFMLGAHSKDLDSSRTLLMLKYL
jgi:hypothetical protein